MRAWELQAYGLENLRLVERPRAALKPHEARIAMRAAALNSRDLQVIANQYDPHQRLPVVPVSDGVGEVIEIGSAVARVKIGDRVSPAFAQGWIAGARTWERWLTHVGGHYDGMLQEEIVLPAEGLVRVPSYLSDAEAAAACVAATTAWQALVVEGKLFAGQTVLVQGTGGVALFALQFAKLHGARVIVIASSDERLRRAAALGAWGLVNYRTTPNWADEVNTLTGGAGVDHIIDTVGDLEKAVGCLATGGLISLIGYTGQMALDAKSAPAYRYSADVIATLLRNARLQGISAAPRESAETMLRAMEMNEVRPVIDSVFAFENAPDALRKLADGGVFGKVCIAAPVR
jgi:NADPH:quinone reductase-like Zn-dependent oxidoreductase